MEHCWHTTGIQKTCYPPIDVVKCCFCGRTADQHKRPYVIPGHGPHAAPVYGLEDIEPLEGDECEARL